MKLTSAHQQILFDTVRRVFEEAAFVSADSPDDFDAGGQAFPRVASVIKFHGRFSGVLAMACPVNLVTTTAANIMGLDENDPAARENIDDSLGEVLNMICGNLLTEIAGTKPEFKIEAPCGIAVSSYERFAERNDPDATARAQLFMLGGATDVFLMVSAEGAEL